MKKKCILFYLLFCPVFFLFSKNVSAQSRLASKTDPIVSVQNNFISPPESARPWVYWFWINSNVSREGITADLESMKRVGIGGVLIMDVNLNAFDRTPNGLLRFMDVQWKAMFRFAVEEAKRLGIEVNMTNDAGWTGSGGPWITPENAMQTVVFSETKVAGTSLIDEILPQPLTKADYYRDIAVMAVPYSNTQKEPSINFNPSLNIFTDEKGSKQSFPTEKNPIKLSFQNPEKLPSLSVQFESPYTACVLDLTAVGLDGWIEAALQISKNGKEFKTAKTITLKNGKNSLVFNMETASHYKIQFLKSHISGDTVVFSGLEVHNRYHIENLPMKAVFLKSGNQFQPAGLNETAPADMIISREKVIDLTKFMDTSGRLKWKAPAGQWTVLRFGHTFTGAMNGPALGVEGPECDKLSKSGIRIHFDGMMKKLIELVGPDSKRTLVATHIDSWEVGAQNWTRTMGDEFRKRRGYDLVPYLPVLAGRVIGDLQLTERFLWDFRKTISELMVENYVAEMQKVSNENGLRFSFESYNTIGNDLDAANWTDEPMGEFWTRNGGDWYFDKVKGMSSAAHLNNRPVTGAESFTAAEEERWLSHPANIKAVGDRFFCDGVNRFVFHRYAMQPWLNQKPGMSMGPYGLHYERTQTWWEYSLPWHKYLARCQYVLRQGTFVSDVLNLQPEEPIHRFRIMNLTGYDYDACSPDAFQHVKIENGKLIDGSGNSHQLIVLKHSGVMTEPMLRRIRDLVVRGAVVLGDPPMATPGLTDYLSADSKLKALVEELWGTGSETVTDRKVGKGRVFRNISPEEALNRIGIFPDFVADKKLRYIHRKINESDIYFVANSVDSNVVANCSFRVTGKRPHWWNPETGQIKPLTTYTSGEGVTHIPLVFDPSGSGFVVFSPETEYDSERIVKITRDGETLFQDGMSLKTLNTKSFKENSSGFLNEGISLPGTYIITKASGKKLQMNFSNKMEAIEISGPWKLQFSAANGASKEVQLNQLESWTSLPDKELNYFSGTGTYFKTISIPANSIKNGNQLFLDLGKVQVMAKVFVNGKDAGIVWKAPYRINISSLVHKGENSLKIEVVNLWVNRQIGDENLPEDSERNPNGTLKHDTWPDWISQDKQSPTGRQTFTTWRLWKKDEPLQKSGMLGPVTLQQIKPIK